MIRIKSVTPTVFFRQNGGMLEQRIMVTLSNDGELADASLRVNLPGLPEQWVALSVPAVESEHEIYIPEILNSCSAGFTIEMGGRQLSRYETELDPQRKWTVHVVQLSHHDPGYTDLPSIVLEQHDQWLDEAVDMAERTDAFPDDAKFSLVNPACRTGAPGPGRREPRLPHRHGLFIHTLRATGAHRSR